MDLWKFTEEGWCGSTECGACGRSVVVWRGIACGKLESAQMRVGGGLLEERNTVAGVAVQGDLGWRKLEKREEMKVLLVRDCKG